nr:uncharacterized protein LOC105347086 [Crassostrea gigas]
MTKMRYICYETSKKDLTNLVISGNDLIMEEFVFVAFGAIISVVYGDIILQTDKFCSICNEEYCRNPAYYLTKYNFQNPNDNLGYENVRSQSLTFYQDSRNCIVSIKGKPEHQIEATLEVLDIDAYHGPVGANGIPSYCKDFLKLFNGPRVDNARLIPGFPPGGLCGTIRSSADFPNVRSFKTTQNELTVQFVTDNKKDSKIGFNLRIRQYPYSNPGNLYPDGSNPGGWNDGSFNEFQNNWDEQIVIPGGVGPGSGNDYDTEQNGLTCYSCDYCNVEPFKPEDTGVGTKSGCHVCSKEWDDEYQVAQRKCYSQIQYYQVLQTLGTVAEPVTDYIGCKKHITLYQRAVNYCFCKSNKCNGGSPVIHSPLVITFGLLLVKVLTTYYRL